MSIPETAIQSTPGTPPGVAEARFRSEIGQISRHSAVFFLGTLFTAAAGYLFKIYVARVLGAGALGIYALGMTLVGFFGLFSGLGLPQAVVRFVASLLRWRHPQRGVLAPGAFNFSATPPACSRWQTLSSRV